MRKERDSNSLHLNGNVNMANVVIPDDDGQQIGEHPQVMDEDDAVLLEGKVTATPDDGDV